MNPLVWGVLLVGILSVPSGHGFVSDAELFPFGEEHGDSRLPDVDDTFAPVPLSQGRQFTFFNDSYNQLFVSTNGAISFSRGVSQYTPSCGSLSTPMIIPFWADIDPRIGGKVFYRESTSRTLLMKASQELQKSFTGISDINLDWIFIATWHDVAFYGSNSHTDSCNGNRLRNTFQAILTTDGTRSFAIFYYNDIKWTTGTASGGDQCTGLNGSPAKAGFDVGDGVTFFEIPGTCSTEIVNIPQTSNVNEPGKWIFRIDHGFQSTVCQSSGTVVIERLRFSPAFVSIFGHAPVIVKGPCLENAIDAKCRFHDVNVAEVPALISPDKTFATCQLPYLYTNGRIKVDLILTHAHNLPISTYSGYIYTKKPREDLLTFDLVGTNNFALSWDSTNFLHLGAPQPLKLELVVYSGNVWVSLGIIADNLPNTGSFQGVLNNLGIQSFNTLTGMYAVNLQNAEGDGSFLYSGIKFHLGSQSGIKPKQLCDSWYKNDRGPPTDMLPCPPLLEQARVDQRFEPITDEVNGINHAEAEFRFRQRIPSQSGTGQQCMYLGGRIIVGPPNGGTAELVSPNGAGGAIEHFKEDVIPWLTCCKLSKSAASCRRYYERRPSDSGELYEAPRPAFAFGDPHITTFDLLQYTFNGVGEFWMIVDTGTPTDTFLMQSRMVQFVQNSGAPSDASVFTAFVMKMDSPMGAVHIQVSLTLSGIQVLLDGELIEVAGEAGVFGLNTVMHNGASIQIFSSRKVTVGFSSGYSFEFTATSDNSALNMQSSASAQLHGRTRGLLGIFDGVKENDLTAPDGVMTTSSGALQEIHNFGVKWRTIAVESLFVYPEGKTHASYQNEEFVPNFQQPDISSLPTSVVSLCGGSVECLFDFRSTGSLDISVGTLEVVQSLNETVEIVSMDVDMCHQLIAPQNGYFEAENFFAGAEVTFYCDGGFDLVGEDELTCVAGTDGRYSWNNDVPTCAEVEDDGSGYANWVNTLLQSFFKGRK